MQNPVVTRADWLKARIDLLEEEKAFTRARDALTRKRMALPWVRVETDYAFDTPTGRKMLAGLFDGRSQLIVYHFMLGPGWAEGCKSCSFWADNFDRIPVHLAHRDVTFTAISRAPLDEIEAYRRRMGWTFPWASSAPSDFNYDVGASFTDAQVAARAPLYNFGLQTPGTTDLPGISVFARDESGAVFHTYSTFARGIDMMNGAYHYLDLVPKGRDEDDLAFTMEWVRRHDQYGT
ncbi:DUF899 domain-containing protein [Zavarzinia sp. CC-PAN008]|uniref:DUF899 domain-containing protein n=1 Tax=Zavarzinia sp. CC-PAN008 TaxID=3243332 RepID=UPI003F74521C